VNDRKVTIPSLQVHPGAVISVRPKSKKIERIVNCFSAVDRRGVPAWLEVDKKEMQGTVKHLPSREEIPLTVREQLIVELYSK
jgi:small subunit ribosomal protein S4